MTDAICDRCGRLASQHSGPKMFCPFVSTFRAPEPLRIVTNDAVNISETVRSRLGFGRATDFDAWLTRALQQLAERENDGEEWKR